MTFKIYNEYITKCFILSQDIQRFNISSAPYYYKLISHYDCWSYKINISDNITFTYVDKNKSFINLVSLYNKFP